MIAGNRQVTVHHFEQSLAVSEHPTVRAMWERFYSRFPGIESVTRNCADNEAQRRGVDAVLFFGNDRVYRVDEKIDSHPPVNFFLEYISNDRTNAPGWIEKQLSCDFIAYAFPQYGRCFFMPWVGLQMAWMQNREEWKAVYKSHDIRNKTYSTRGIAVPRRVVWKAVHDAMTMTDDYGEGGAV